MARAVDAEEFLDLLEPLRDSLYRFTARNVWRKDQVHDILQEAIMTAWEQFDRFEPGTNFRAWMFRILLNTLYRINRKTNRSKEVRLDGEGLNAGELADRERAWASLLEEPERVVQALDDRIVTALESLAPTERSCFLLRLLEDFSYKEIAEALKVPMGTVMSHVFRARMKLRERLVALATEEGFVRQAGD